MNKKDEEEMLMLLFLCQLYIPVDDIVPICERNSFDILCNDGLATFTKVVEE